MPTRPSGSACTRIGSLILFSNELQRCWTKPNVQGVVPLGSLELRFEDVWLS